MFEFLIRRLLIGVFTLLCITFLQYALLRFMPGTPLTLNLAELDPTKTISVEQMEQLKKIYGLDKPFYEAYAIWLKQLLQGDMGNSFTHKKPVARLITERLGPTLFLSITSLLVAYAAAVPMGLFVAARSGTKTERGLSTALYMLYSFPNFVAALLLQMWVALKLGWFPLFGMFSDNYDSLSTLGKVKDLFWHLTLPLICYTYAALAYDVRFINANLQEVIRQDYIRTAKAKGLSGATILVKHAFRNTLIPLITSLGLMLPSLVSGAVIIEQIFSWPGIGRMFFESITARDYPTLMGLLLMFSVMTVVGQLLADILYALVDPRVRLGDR